VWVVVVVVVVDDVVECGTWWEFFQGQPTMGLQKALGGKLEYMTTKLAMLS
jgi:hypothetical protein